MYKDKLSERFLIKISLEDLARQRRLLGGNKLVNRE